MKEINMISGRVKDYDTTYTADADKNFDLEISTHSSLAVQVIMDSLSALDSTLTIQGSNDGTNFDTFSNGAMDLDAADGSVSRTIDIQAYKYIRAKYEKGSVASGTIKILAVIKPCK